MFQQMLRRYFKGEASEEEKGIVDAWYEAMGKGDQSLLDDFEKAALEQRYWSVISGHITRTRNANNTNILQPATRTRRMVWYSMGVAASLLFAIMSWYLLNDTTRPAMKATTIDQRQSSVIWTQLDNTGESVKQFSLPDGSRISLEPHSRLNRTSAIGRSFLYQRLERLALGLRTDQN